MNRRNFLKAVSALAAAAVAAPLIGAGDAPKVMQHVYENGDGERIAANSIEDAARFHDCTLGGAAHPDMDDWSEIADDEALTIGFDYDATQSCSYGNGHSGPGWYVYDPEYTDDGSLYFGTTEPQHPATKTAREWAAGHTEPGYVSSTYC